MKLTIVSPEKTKNFVIEWVELIAATGAITILPNHAPQIMSLKSDKLISFVETNGSKQSFTVVNGLAEISRNEVIILTSFLL